MFSLGGKEVIKKERNVMRKICELYNDPHEIQWINSN